MALTNKLTAIADAIREKNGETKQYTLDEMPTAISEISGGSEADIIADFVSGTSDKFRNLELNVSTVSSYAFYFQRNVDTLIIRGLKNLASSNYAFSRSYLKHVELYKSEDVDKIIVNTDGRYFEYCGSLESVFIDKLDKTPNYMFRNCTKLKRVICGSVGLGSYFF